MLNGIFLHGTFCGTDEREFKNDNGTVRTAYYVLITSGKDFYKIAVDKDYSGQFLFGDHVVFNVRARSYNDNVYYSGSWVEDGEDL